MPNPRISPETRMDLRFLTATNEVAQHPSAGVALVGATAIRYMNKGTLSAAEVLSPRLAGNNKKDIVAITAAAHRLVGAYGMTTETMNKTVPFAYDGLLMGSFISTAVEFDKGGSGSVLPTIDVLSDEQRERFAVLASNPDQMYRLGGALADVAAELMRADGAAQDPIDLYHDTIMEVSARYVSEPGNPGRFQELGEARDDLAGALTPIVGEAFSWSLNTHDTEVAAANLLRHTPADALLGKYFAPSQQG